MPKRNDIQRILIIGAGPIVIGQACEFDYSGTQACKALKEEGYTVILVNSNPATIMTDPDTADRIYIEPIVPEVMETIIQKEKPDAILPTVGGQTGLNCALELYQQGILDKYGVQLIGASPEAIEKAENRQLFNEAMAKINLDVPKNAVVNSLESALSKLPEIGLPAIVRPSFTLGGSGGGIAHTKEEFVDIVSHGLDMSPTNEVLIDESILGWKEYEMEVVRDKADNAIIICSIENVDPMGIHTGDSITVAPALTLTDKEYQRMRDASIAVLREIGVETGGSNVQFAVNPENGRLIIIEMNPRVSRSSALASKATGFPIAKVAAKLAVGYTLDEIKNDITKVTPASFEPTIDYVVTKIPRFTFEKFNEADPILSSQMKSVGEVMAIGRSFAESVQKGLRSLEIGLNGFNESQDPELLAASSLEEKQTLIKKKLEKFSPNRILLIADAIRYGIDCDTIYQITKVDPWFVAQINTVVQAEQNIKENGLPDNDAQALLALKKLGFSDERLATLLNKDKRDIRALRHAQNILPVYKTVDTCAAEFNSFTPYLYSCYEGNIVQATECESSPTQDKKVIILGGGPNRIGQGIEFDYACVHAAFSLSEESIQSIMVNCNPETVSTDYDTSDKLYFEPLCDEDVVALIQRESQAGELLGVIVQFGGQTPLKLCSALTEANIPIIGTSPDSIDLAEDRERFKALLEHLNLRQPDNDICHSIDQIQNAVDRVGLPVVVRPSNVLGGRAMAIIHNQKSLDDYIAVNKDFILDGPILIDKFLDNAIEIDVDALSDGEDVHIAGIMEHIELAGIHSGDSACSLPPYSLNDVQVQLVKESTVKLAKALHVVGLMNIQFAFKGNDLYVIEVNPRASRTVPFVAKATGVSIAKLAAKLMIGRKLREFNLTEPSDGHYAVKEVVFPFARFQKVDTLLGPEMKSTGEVMGIDKTFPLAFAKAQWGVGNPIPSEGNILITVQEKDKADVVALARTLLEAGYGLYCTKGTADYLATHGINNVTRVNKEREGGESLVDMIRSRKIQLVINTPSSCDQDIKESFSLRRASLMSRVPYITTLSAAKSVGMAIKEMKNSTFSIMPVQELTKKLV